MVKTKLSLVLYKITFFPLQGTDITGPALTILHLVYYAEKMICSSKHDTESRN